MRLIDYLDTLNWTQSRLAQEAKVSSSTIQRVMNSKSITRQNADKICTALTNAFKRPIGIRDVNEIHVTPSERPQRRKVARRQEEPPIAEE